MPVSTLTWIFTGRPSAWAASERALALSRSPTDWVSRSRTGSADRGMGVGPRTRMGAVMPDTRSSAASSMQATAR